MMRHNSDAWRWFGIKRWNVAWRGPGLGRSRPPSSSLLMSTSSISSSSSSTVASRKYIVYPYSTSTNRMFYSTSFSSFTSAASDAALAGSNNKFDDIDHELRAQLSKFKVSMAYCINHNDYDGAKKIFDEIIDHPQLKKCMHIVHMFFSLCQQAEHLPIVLSAIAKLNNHNIPITEQCYFTLIRCYADADMIDEIWDVLDVMKVQRILPRLRTLQPILEAYSKQGNLTGTLRILNFMKASQLEPRPEQITCMLNAYARACRKYQANSTSALTEKDREKLNTMKKEVDDFLHRASDSLFGVPMEELEQISAVTNNMTLDEVRDIGVLVESVDDIGGSIISDANLAVDGTVVALNATYDNIITSIDPRIPSPSTHSPYLPLGLKADAVHFIPQKFSIWDEKKKLFMAALREQNVTATEDPTAAWLKVANTIDAGVEQKCVTVSEQQASGHTAGHHLYVGIPDLLKERALPARLVHVSNKSCRCPHCGGDILNVELSERVKQEVCDALMRAAAENSSNQTQQLQDFVKWLKARPEFDCIIDGPNVAYQNQNHRYGRFSYKQIEFVVKKMKEMGRRPLVILPACYSIGRNYIPNSIRGSMRFVTLNDEEKLFLRQLCKEDMLYTVPNGANDDWYWMYSTIYPGRKTPAFVLTNDLMRDHKVSFLAPLPFIRWRTTQIMYYSIFRHVNYSAPLGASMEQGLLNSTTTAVPEKIPFNYEDESYDEEFIKNNLPANSTANATTTTNSTIPAVDSTKTSITTANTTGATTNTVNKAGRKHRQRIPEVPPFNDMAIDGEVFMIGPGNFSREIQRSVYTNRWHIPALDSNMWLCVNTELRIPPSAS